MSNPRIALSQEDAELICVALDYLHTHSIINPTVFPEYALASKQRIEQLKAKLPETLPSVPASESERVAVPNPNQKENTQ